jgi:hypothetical protein
MDSITLCLAIMTSMSEILPLLGFTQANGILHGLHCTFLHLSADSQCHVEADVEARSPPLTAHSSIIALSSSGGGAAAPGAAAGPAAIAAFEAAPP